MAGCAEPYALWILEKIGSIKHARSPFLVWLVCHEATVFERLKAGGLDVDPTFINYAIVMTNQVLALHKTECKRAIANVLAADAMTTEEFDLAN